MQKYICNQLKIIKKVLLYIIVSKKNRNYQRMSFIVSWNLLLRKLKQNLCTRSLCKMHVFGQNKTFENQCS